MDYQLIIQIIVIAMSVIVMIGLLVFLIPSTFFTVRQQKVAIIERFGKFRRISQAGLRMKVPFIENIAVFLSLKIQQLDVNIETKTKDNVFVMLNVSVQFRVLERFANDAHYMLDNPKDQIRAYVFDVVRAEVPNMELDAVFQNKDSIADAVKKELSDPMKEFGYLIVKSLVTDIDPDQKVKDSMNEINAAQRSRFAAEQRAEADQITTIKNAEADAKSTELHGQGLAEKRKAIAMGIKDSLQYIKTAAPDLSSKELMNTIMLSQYIETLREIGKASNTMMVPSTPDTFSHFEDQIRNAIVSARQMEIK